MSCTALHCKGLSLRFLTPAASQTPAHTRAQARALALLRIQFEREERSVHPLTMKNDEGEVVDLYIPRKW